MKLPYSTLALMLDAHNGQTDKSGLVYALHPIRVAYRLRQIGSEHPVRAALLHNVIQDTPWTAADLLRMGEPEPVVDIVSWVTRPTERPRATYLDWIRAIASEGPLGARLVKLADIYDNLSPSRMAALSESERDGRTWRYEQALKLLLASIPEQLSRLVPLGDVHPRLSW